MVKTAQKTSVLPISRENKNSFPEGFFFGENGLNYLDPNSDSASPVFICSKLEITATTRDQDGNNWGRVLEFDDLDGKRKRWVMPMEMLAGRGELLHCTLLNMGLNLNTSAKAKNLLAQYIQLCKPEKKSVCVDRIGWHEGCYVLPERTIGDTKGKEILLQTAHPDSLGFKQAGTLADWQNHVSRFAVANSRLAFAISASFAAPLLEFFNVAGGGFHFRGESSKGKTISLYTAGSVWGSHERKQTWRATSNGLEETAHSHNNNILLIDELGQMESRDVGETVYMLANGQGKKRMTETKRKAWRVLFLSTGEIDLKTMMLEAGKITKAGQEVRFIDLEAVAGDLGVFDTLFKDFLCSADQAHHLERATNQYYGTAGIEFITQFIDDKTESIEFLKRTQKAFIDEVEPEKANSQVKRVLNLFSMVASAGELATAFNITGWQTGEAIQAAKKCFNSWLNNLCNVTHSQEHHQAIERVKAFIEKHGESRFTNLDAPDPMPTRDRAGFKKREDAGTVYYFLPSVFRNEVCKGLNMKTVKAALKIADLLITGSDGKDALKRVPEHKNPIRLVALSGSILE